MSEITQSPPNGSTTDKFFNLLGGVLDTAVAVKLAPAAPATVSPTSAPRITDALAKALPPGQTSGAPQALPNQWKLWLGGTVAIGAVITFALLALRRPRGA